MKKYKIIIMFFLYFTPFLTGQTIYEEKWTKYYEPIENKIMGIWPHNNRFTDVSKLKELKYRWGFNHILLARSLGLEYYNKIIEAGFDSTKIMKQIKQDTYLENIESLPQMSAYFIDEPSELGENFTVWNIITDWIKDKHPDSKIVLGGYKRNNTFKDYVNTMADNVMFTSYKHWWEFLGIWTSWPENLDQRSDWTDMQNIFGNKFSFSWVGAHKDLSEYDDLLGKAKNIQLSGVYLYQLEPFENEVDNNNLEKFSNAASNHGYLNTNWQQVRELYIGGMLINRKLMGFSYSSAIPDNFDHSIMRFEDYIVTNNRIEDYFAEAKIIVGDSYYYIVPANKNSSFNSNSEIILKDGFHSEYGSEFRANIGDE